jgi:hypothetical protein
MSLVKHDQVALLFKHIYKPVKSFITEYQHSVLVVGELFANVFDFFTIPKRNKWIELAVKPFFTLFLPDIH